MAILGWAGVAKCCYCGNNFYFSDGATMGDFICGGCHAEAVKCTVAAVGEKMKSNTRYYVRHVKGDG